jgi:O-antigen/teichoic acid export membrane protein
MEKEKQFNKIKTLSQTGFFHIFGSSVINKFIGFLSSVILVRILTKVEYGTFTYAWNIYSIVLLFNGMGMDSGVLQLASEHSGDAEYANRIYIYGTKFSLKFNLILVMVLLGIGLFAPLKIEAGSKLICALSVLPVFQLLYGLTLSYLRAQKRNQEYAKIQVVHTALVFIVSVGFVIPFRETGMVIGHYVAYIVAYLIGLLIFHTPLISKNAGELGEDKKLLLKISFISMLNNGLVLRVVIRLLYSKSGVSIYSNMPFIFKSSITAWEEGFLVIFIT